MRQGDRNNLPLGKRYAAFGYNNLVSDMRSLAIMRETGCLIAFGAAHSVSVQYPSGLHTPSGGERECAPVVAVA